MNVSIAIVVPVYNAEKHLYKCISSIQEQTFSDFKLILVDDGSKDSSGRICDQFATKDSRICVIHQENKGSVEARKTGVLSSVANEAEYITLVDADDVLEKKALEQLYKMAKKYEADCVCGRIRHLWKGMHIPTKYRPRCFDIKREEVYLNKDIIEQLYISCFGISNYPVSLCAKLYKSALIRKAIDFAPIVKFIGDDLSVTLRCLPETQKLVIIPNVIYNYRVGGGTSRFMPDMLDDFISLYNNKKYMATRYSILQDVNYYMNVELMNIVICWLEMCYKQGGYSDTQLKNECDKICKISEIRSAAEDLNKRKYSRDVVQWILDRNVDELKDEILGKIESTRIKNKIIEMLKRI